MDERTYSTLTDAAFRRIEDMLADVDPDEVDLDRSGDVLTLTLRGGARCVINTQRPTRQIWLAHAARAWHFRYDEQKSAWVDDKGQGVELLSHVASIVGGAAKPAG
ncbi:MAG: iron donor protein CyaY [Myxococcales bacterium]|nr:iron donor protein CyaY [Myxococcales bacterium]